MKTCIICGKMFTNCFPRGRAKTCGAKCSEKRRKQLMDMQNERQKARRELRRLMKGNQ